MENLVEFGSSSNEGDDLEEGPSGERWPPLGAAAVDDDQFCDQELEYHLGNDTERLRDLEEQQELLNSSLIALTTHFAQVQFRLRQICDAADDMKEPLLKDLAEFAFRGIPELPDACNIPVYQKDDRGLESAIDAQKKKQRELISQLKGQLEELEHYAYEMGEAGLPQSVLMEKQKVIIDELKEKLNLKVDDMDRLTLDDLRVQVDSAVSQLVNPLKMKEQLVIQLKTQIVDLERFINFLQADSCDAGQWPTWRDRGCGCECPIHSKPLPEAPKKGKQPQFTFTQDARCGRARRPLHAAEEEAKSEEVRQKAVNMMRRAATLLQIFAVSQFGCGTSAIRLNSLKRSMKINHWGDLRARLELSVLNVLAIRADAANSQPYEYCSDNEAVSSSDVRLTTAVRKQLAVCIRDLMQHGLIPIGQSSSLVPLMGCLPMRNKDSTPMHAWELILRYYELKNGARFNSTPVRRLSQSFNLNIVGSKAISNKQCMLGAVGNILAIHTQFKRGYDAQFKAFICAGLNSKKLVVWLRLIFRCQALIETYYEPWAYVVKTGFEDSLQSLDKLNSIDFDLPVDVAVHHFQNIKDAF